MFLNLINNGLRAYESQEYGGWAGRRKELSEEEKTAGFTAPYSMSATKDEVLPDFLPAIQNNFAARFNWSVTSKYEDANHEPVIEGPLQMTAAAGSTVKINVKVYDPDGDQVSLNWMQYQVGSYKGDVSIDDMAVASTSMAIPSDARSGDTIHLVLTAADNQTLSMTSYHRIILTIK